MGGRMKQKPRGWRNEPNRHALSARGINTNSRGIRKRTSIAGQSLVELYRPSTWNIMFRHTDLKLFAYDKAYEALDSNNWSLEGAYDFLNEELEQLKAEYAVSKNDETKLQIEITQLAKYMVRERRSFIKSWPEKREEWIEKTFGED